MAASASISKVSPVHQQLADWLISNGGQTKGWNKRAAEKFGYTQAWLSIIYHSDAFQDYYKLRVKEFGDAVVLGLAEKVNGVAGQALDILAEKLETQGDTLPVSQVLDIADMTLKRAGFGEKAAAPTQINNYVVGPEQLEAARSAMRGAKQIELKASEVLSEGKRASSDES